MAGAMKGCGKRTQCVQNVVRSQGAVHIMKAAALSGGEIGDPAQVIRANVGQTRFLEATGQADLFVKAPLAESADLEPTGNDHKS